MNKKMNNILLVLAACILLPALSYAAFEPVAIGARPAAMGGAYTAIADDVYSVYYNPAGLSLVPRMEFTTQYSQLYTGLWDKSNLNYSFLGLAQPLMFKRDFGTVGLSVLNFTAGSLYRESTITLSYGRNFKIGGIRKLDVGFNVKSLTIGYGTDEYTYDSLNDDGITHSLQGGAARADSLFEKYGFSKSAVAIDIGVKYALFTNYKLGLMISNINEPGIALDSTSDAKLPRMINLGFAHNGKGYLVSVDYMSRQVNKVSDSRISIAAEKLLPMGFGLRSSVALGSRELTNFAVGFGYQSSGLQIDYALEYPISGIKSTMGNHKVSLTLKFGPVMHVPEEAGALQVALEKEQKARAQTEVALAEKNKELEKKLHELIEFARENDALQHKVHEFVTALFAARDLATLREMVPHLLREIFSVPHTALHLWQATPPSAEVLAFTDAQAQPVCLHQAAHDTANWFGETGKHLHSFAYLPLHAGSESIGLLDSPVNVATHGGTLTIAWAGEGEPVLMTGPAITVFEGEINL